MTLVYIKQSAALAYGAKANFPDSSVASISPDSFKNGCLAQDILPRALVIVYKCRWFQKSYKRRNCCHAAANGFQIVYQQIQSLFCFLHNSLQSKLWIIHSNFLFFTLLHFSISSIKTTSKSFLNLITDLNLVYKQTLNRNQVWYQASCKFCIFACKYLFIKIVQTSPEEKKNQLT